MRNKQILFAAFLVPLFLVSCAGSEAKDDISSEKNISADSICNQPVSIIS